MAVRPFWVEADIDGRKTLLAGGSRSSTGEMTVKISQRSDGSIEQPVTIRCYRKMVNNEDKCCTDIFVNGVLCATHQTNY